MMSWYNILILIFLNKVHMDNYLKDLLNTKNLSILRTKLLYLIVLFFFETIYRNKRVFF